MGDMTQFRITYDGPALATHEMDAKELAPALMAMADLLESSVRALHGDRAKAQINVKVRSKPAASMSTSRQRSTS